MMESHSQPFQAARQKVATRLGVLTTEVLADPNAIVNDIAQSAVLNESVILTNRFALAAKMVDRHDVSPAALKANPLAKSPAITMTEAFEASMNLEQIPRYDHIFVIMLENKAATSVDVTDVGQLTEMVRDIAVMWVPGSKRSTIQVRSTFEPRRRRTSSTTRSWGSGTTHCWRNSSTIRPVATSGRTCST